MELLQIKIAVFHLLGNVALGLAVAAALVVAVKIHLYRATYRRHR